MNIKMTKKNKERITVISLVTAIITTSFFNLSKLSKKTTNTSTISNPTINSATKDNAIDNETTVNLEPDKDFLELISEIEGEYNFDLSRLTLPDVNDFNNICTVTYDTTSIDPTSIYTKASELIEEIRKNSQNYLEEHSEYTSAFLEKNSNHDEIMVQTMLKDAISDILENGTNKDICIIEDLRVVISYDSSLVDTYTYAKYFENDNLLIVFPDNVRSNVEKKGVNQYKELRYAIQCELNVIRQQICKCQDNNIEFPYETLEQSAIKSELYNLGKTEITVNNTLIQHENLILLLGLFHDNVTINNYYNAIFSNDIQALYNFCNIKSKEDIFKFNRILYAMDILNGMDIISNSTNKDIKEIVGYDYKVDLYSLILKNMITYTREDTTFKLEDNLILFNTIKEIIINDLPNYLDEDIATNITALNDTYINFLNNHYNVTIDKINEILNSNDINNYTSTLINICNGNSSTSNKENTSKVIPLIKKFPLLKIIYNNFDINNSTLANISSNKYALVRKKHLTI